MSGKIIDLNPATRLSKEALDMMKKRVQKTSVDDTRSIIMIVQDGEGKPSLYAYGLDFEAIGFAQAAMAELGSSLLSNAFNQADTIEE